MFKDILSQYIKKQGISQSELSELVGDSQQAISDFLKKKGNPQKKTKEKYFKYVSGFEDYYNNITGKKDSVLNQSELFSRIKNLEEYRIKELETMTLLMSKVMALEKELLKLKSGSKNG